MRALAGCLVTSLLLAVPFQVSSQEMTQEQEASIQAEVMAFADAWVEVWEENDCETAAAFLPPDRLQFMWAGSFLSRSDWMGECSRVLETRAGFTGQMLDGEGTVLTPQAAFITLTLEQHYTYTDGSTRHYPRSAQMGLVELTESGWVFTTFGNNNGPFETGQEG